MKQVEYERVIICVVGCSCGAKRGELCVGKHGPHLSVHTTRRDAAQRWKKATPFNRKEWERLKFETLWPPHIMGLVNEGY